MVLAQARLAPNRNLRVDVGAHQRRTATQTSGGAPNRNLLVDKSGGFIRSVQRRLIGDCDAVWV
ncbi:hypothetical protein, partial [Promicromonospora umidemergens]|uniref:hypothetical protein n=1 Tax=Promicromonospora umidemergens TaxID=629679 RepID=UPI0031E50FF6